jgi:type III pantothenate kinase
MAQWWALMIGNSRFHWGAFEGDRLQNVIHTAHGTLPEAVGKLRYVASVVPAQTTWIQNQIPDVRLITLRDLPLKNTYVSLGIDRALAVWGAGQVYGFPCLVIDGGTALTFSGADGDRQWVGGAILPGLRLQMKSLVQGTAALPAVTLPDQLPDRWANNTPQAIASGIARTILAGVKDFTQAWQGQFPRSQLLVTGGDGPWLAQQLPELLHDPALIFRGFQGLE